MSNMLSSLLKPSHVNEKSSFTELRRVKTNHICKICSSVCFLDSMHSEITCTNCGIVAQTQFCLHEDFECKKNLKNAEYTSTCTTFSSNSDCKDPEHWSEVDEFVNASLWVTNVGPQAISSAVCYKKKKFVFVTILVRSRLRSNRLRCVFRLVGGQQVWQQV